MIRWQIHIQLAQYFINCLGSLPIPVYFPRPGCSTNDSRHGSQSPVFSTAAVLPHTPEAILHVSTYDSELYGGTLAHNAY